MAKATSQCVIDGCFDEIIARGWCSKHYCRWKKHRDPEYSRPMCSVDGCGKLAWADGMCSRHHRKLVQFGDPSWARPKAGDTRCSIDGCDQPAKSRGWCYKHWARWRRNGDPVKPNPRKDLAVDYDDGTRLCRLCQERLPIDRFDKDRSASGGRRSQCKTCRGKLVSDWYHANADERKEKSRQARRANIKAVREYDQKRYRRDKPKRIALATESVHRRRARLANAGRSDRGITVAALQKRDGNYCHFCGKSMVFKAGKQGIYNPRRASVEHLIPINTGGLHVWENVALSCLGCNLSRPKDGGSVQLPLVM